jgi:hypothetical protein
LIARAEISAGSRTPVCPISIIFLAPSRLSGRPGQRGQWPAMLARSPAQLTTPGHRMNGETKKPQAFSRCGHRAKNCSVLKSSLQPRRVRHWCKFSPVWSRNCRSCSRNRTRVAELKHHAERVRHLTINHWDCLLETIENALPSLILMSSGCPTCLLVSK